MRAEGGHKDIIVACRRQLAAWIREWEITEGVPTPVVAPTLDAAPVVAPCRSVAADSGALEEVVAGELPEPAMRGRCSVARRVAADPGRGTKWWR